MFAFSRHECPSFARRHPPKLKRAQGMPDAGRTHGPPAKEKAGGRRHRFSRNNRHSLRDGFNGVLRALPGNRAFLLPSPAAFVTPASLTPASGCQDHTTSPSAKTPFVRTSDRARRHSVHRSPASRVVTIAMRPSSSRRDARRIHGFLENGSKIFSDNRVRGRQR